MTHDELLEKIDEYNKFLITYSTLAEDYSTFTIVTAIRAVVELHKMSPLPWDTENTMTCDGCGEVDVCPTIQAIEKELQ